MFLRPRILGRSLIYVIAVNTPGLLFFIFQFQFDNDEMTGVCIKCNCCKKTVTCQFSETVTIDILPVFIKVVGFHNLGLSWMIETKDQYKFCVKAHFIE